MIPIHVRNANQLRLPPPVSGLSLCDRQRFGTAQAGQDKIFFQKTLAHCGTGVFVEFGARDGIEHSNTLWLEQELKWRGILVEADRTQVGRIRSSRPRSQVYEGAVCPSGMKEITWGQSSIPGWSGFSSSYEPQRVGTLVQNVTVQCLHLADLLRQNNYNRVDFMSIDTEGSEEGIIKDFPWDEFDVRYVQIEQLAPESFPAQRGRQQRIERHMRAHSYTMVRRIVVADRDTYDLVFERGRGAALKPLPKPNQS